MKSRWQGGIAVVGVLGLVAWWAMAVAAQGPPATLRVAFLSQWTVNQHRDPGAATLRTALDGGVVDRLVFSWQAGLIQRGSLVPKPVHLLSGPDADTLGARGRFRLAEVRPPTAAAAWNEVEVVPETNRPDDVAVVEIGGEVTTVGQVLATLFVLGPEGRLIELPLVPAALIPGAGIPVLRVPFGRPLPSSSASMFYRGPGGLEVLVARSPVEVVVNGGVTASGPADVASNPGQGSGDWREADRVFVRIPLPVLRTGAPGLVFGWKDRKLRSDGDGSCPRSASC